MERIAIYGKGGVGKSVVATALSAHYARSGLKVLHIGCDPKCDSSIRLLEEGRSIATVLQVLAENTALTSVDRVLHEGRLGIVCCESGGPQPGLGCGGRGVAKTLEFLDEMEVISAGDFDVVIFDVLGDVVCGGFAAPLRRGFAQKVFIVISEEPMALFAANNISKAIGTYHRNDVHLGGFISNLKSDDANRAMLERFAAALSTRVLAHIPRDNLILEAERNRRTVVEFAPESESARSIASMARDILDIRVEDLRLPTPFSDDDFFAFIKE
jgi:nitrogenase iron protein NifH